MVEVTFVQRFNDRTSWIAKGFKYAECLFVDVVSAEVLGDCTVVVIAQLVDSPGYFLRSTVHLLL